MNSPEDSCQEAQSLRGSGRAVACVTEDSKELLSPCVLSPDLHTQSRPWLLPAYPKLKREVAWPLGHLTCAQAVEG